MKKQTLIQLVQVILGIVIGALITLWIVRYREAG